MVKTAATSLRRIISEHTDGVQLDYELDPLGTVLHVWDQTSTYYVGTYRAKPFGDTLYQDGPDIRFKWVGSLGYRSTGLAHAEYYVRARHYGTQEGSWTTVDPLWPGEAAYGYVNGNPTNWSDPIGLGCSPVCYPNLVVSEAARKCDVKVDPTDSRYLLVNFYKFMRYTCTLGCDSSGICGNCNMMQEVDDSYIIDGQPSPPQPSGDWTVSGNCPGILKRTDAPGIHSFRTKDSQGSDSIKPSKLPRLTDFTYNGIFHVTCTCGANVSKFDFELHVQITKGNTNKPICSLT